MKYILTLSSLLLLIHITFAQQVIIQQPIRFLALGDSYTIGEGVATPNNWPNQLYDSLQARGLATDSLQIIARTGWRVDNLKQGMRAAQLDSNWTLVSLLIGVNNQFQGGNVAGYRPQFEDMLHDAIQLAGGRTERVMVLSIPDYAFTPFGQSFQDPGAITLDIDSFNTTNRQITQSYGVPYFDITPISRLGLQQPSLVAFDRLHPSGEMYTEWVKLILGNIDIATSVEEENALELQAKLYFDPNRSRLLLQSEQSTEFKLWNLQGQLMISTKVENRIEIPFEHNRAVYVYEFKDEKGRGVRGKLLN